MKTRIGLCIPFCRRPRRSGEAIARICDHLSVEQKLQLIRMLQESACFCKPIKSDFGQFFVSSKRYYTLDADQLSVLALFDRLLDFFEKVLEDMANNKTSIDSVAMFNSANVDQNPDNIDSLEFSDADSFRTASSGFIKHIFGPVQQLHFNCALPLLFDQSDANLDEDYFNVSYTGNYHIVVPSQEARVLNPPPLWALLKTSSDEDSRQNPWARGFQAHEPKLTASLRGHFQRFRNWRSVRLFRSTF